MQSTDSSVSDLPRYKIQIELNTYFVQMFLNYAYGSNL